MQIIYLNTDANYNIDAYMSKNKNSGFGHPIAFKNQISKYKILKRSRKEIKLKIEKGFILLKKQS